MNTADLRLLFQDETVLHRLTSSAPPVVREITEHNRPDGGVYFEFALIEEPAAAIGQSMSAEMVSLVGNVTESLSFYGPRHPIRRALNEWDRSCRRRHRSTSLLWRDHAHQSNLCGQMLRDVIEGGASAWWCAQRYEISYPRTERLLKAGADFLSERYARWQDDQLGIIHDRVRCEVCRAETYDG